MLSIKEKIVFGVLLALFIVPEIMWGGVMHELSVWYNVQFLHTSYVDIDMRQGEQFYFTILFIEAVASILSLILVVIKRKKIKTKSIFGIICAILLLFVALSLSALFIGGLRAFMIVGMSAP